MEKLTLEQLRGIAEKTSYPSISIYLPTKRAPQYPQKSPLIIKKLLRNAEKQLLDSGMGPRAANAILQPIQELSHDPYFWKHQYDGLAVFMAQDESHFYRLPFPVDELLIIANAYYIKPLLPLFTNNGHYYILALSQSELRLFEGTRHSVGQIDLPEDAPVNLAATLKFDEPEKQLQVHGGSSQGGSPAGMFHGQGAGNEEQDVRIEHYLNLVDISLKAIFGERNIPVILAGVDFLLPIYRKVSDYANIMPGGIIGSPEHLRPEELHEQAWPIVDAYFRQETEKVINQYQQLASTVKATDNVGEVIVAAFNGRIDKLILSIENQFWGTFNSDTREVTFDAERQDKQNNLALLDVAAMKTIKNGGAVYALPQEEMPTNSPAAAVLRY